MMKGWQTTTLMLFSFAVIQAQGRNVCNVDADCPDNAFCDAGLYCVCKEGLVLEAINYTHSKCFTESQLGGPCTLDIQCRTKLGIHADCGIDKVCVCANDSHYENGRCYVSTLVGERCQSDANCLLPTEEPKTKQTSCHRGYCTCPMRYSPRDNGTRCVPDAKLYGKCEDNFQCAGPGLECTGVCTCKNGWVAHNDTESCMEKKELGMLCDYNEQCSWLTGIRELRPLRLAVCNGGICDCAYNAHAANNRCWRNRRPGDSCARDEECVTEENEPGYCLSGICSCETCAPDARDFGAASVSRPSVIIAAILTTAAILRQ